MREEEREFPDIRSCKDEYELPRAACAPLLELPPPCGGGLLQTVFLLLCPENTMDVFFKKY
jgi:hypothetical protein